MEAFRYPTEDEIAWYSEGEIVKAVRSMRKRIYEETEHDDMGDHKDCLLLLAKYKNQFQYLKDLIQEAEEIEA